MVRFNHFLIPARISRRQQRDILAGRERGTVGTAPLGLQCCLILHEIGRVIGVNLGIALR